MAGIIICGLGVGTGLAMLLFALFPSPLSAAATIARLEAAAGGKEVAYDELSGYQKLSIDALNASINAMPGWWGKIRKDLSITGTSYEQFATKTVTYTIGLAVLAPLGVAAVSSILKLKMPIGITILAAIPGGALGFSVSASAIRSFAKRQRRIFEGALVSYAELFRIAMAGNFDWTAALHVAADTAPENWTFSEIKGAIRWADEHREHPATGLQILSEKIGVPSLDEFAKTLMRATEGASIADTVGQKAETLRGKEDALMEEDAERQADAMLLPLGIMAIGFMILVFYPAISNFHGAFG